MTKRTAFLIIKAHPHEGNPFYISWPGRTRRFSHITKAEEYITQENDPEIKRYEIKSIKEADSYPSYFK